MNHKNKIKQKTIINDGLFHLKTCFNVLKPFLNTDVMQLIRQEKPLAR